MKQNEWKHVSQIEQISEANSSELDLLDVSNFYWFLIENDKLDTFTVEFIWKRKFMKGDFEFSLFSLFFRSAKTWHQKKRKETHIQIEFFTKFCSIKIDTCKLILACVHLPADSPWPSIRRSSDLNACC